MIKQQYIKLINNKKNNNNNSSFSAIQIMILSILSFVIKSCGSSGSTSGGSNSGSGGGSSSPSPIPSGAGVKILNTSNKITYITKDQVFDGNCGPEAARQIIKTKDSSYNNLDASAVRKDIINTLANTLQLNNIYLAYKTNHSSVDSSKELVVKELFEKIFHNDYSVFQTLVPIITNNNKGPLEDNFFELVKNNDNFNEFFNLVSQKELLELFFLLGIVTTDGITAHLKKIQYAGVSHIIPDEIIEIYKNTVGNSKIWLTDQELLKYLTSCGWLPVDRQEIPDVGTFIYLNYCKDTTEMILYNDDVNGGGTHWIALEQEIDLTGANVGG